MDTQTFDLAYRMAVQRVGGGGNIRDHWDALWFALRIAG